MRVSKAYKIVGALVQAITEALQRGEDVSIPGFGIFRWRTKKATRANCGYFFGGKGTVQMVKDIPARRYVHFKPSKVLLRDLNGN